MAFEELCKWLTSKPEAQEREIGKLRQRLALFETERRRLAKYAPEVGALDWSNEYWADGVHDAISVSHTDPQAAWLWRVHSRERL